MDSTATDPLDDEVLARYVAATSGDAGPELVRDFADWLAADPARQRIAQRLRVDVGETRALRGLFLEEIRFLRQRRVRRRRQWLAAASAAALAVLVVVVGHRTVTVPPGPPDTIALADGSTAVMAGGSALEVPLAPWARSVRLVRGEVLFSVLHDDDAPFTVRSGNADIQDLGTRFVVRAEGDTTSVAVFEGSVLLADQANGWTLVAGQAAAVRPEGLVPLPAESEVDATAWRQGRMVFHDTPLAVAAQRLGTAWNRPIRLGHPALAALRVSGDFRLDDPASVLRGLSLTLPVAVRQGPSGIDLLPR